MAKRKVDVIEDKELFVLQAKLISTSTEKTVEIHDFLKKIEDEENV